MRVVEPSQSRPWWLHGLAIALGSFAYLCAAKFGYGWGGSIGAAAGAVMFPAIIYYRKTGGRERFWLAIVLLVMVQIPFVIAVRPLIEQFRLVFMLVFGVVDCVFVAFGISWMCSQRTSPD